MSRPVMVCKKLIRGEVLASLPGLLVFQDLDQLRGMNPKAILISLSTCRLQDLLLLKSQITDLSICLLLPTIHPVPDDVLALVNELIYETDELVVNKKKIEWFIRHNTSETRASVQGIKAVG